MSERTRKHLIVGITILLLAVILIGVGIALKSQGEQAPAEETREVTSQVTEQEATTDPIEEDTKEVEKEKSGLYVANTDQVKNSWKQLVATGLVVIEDTTITKVNDKLKGDLWIPETITKIAKNAFVGCSGLSGVYMGTSVTEIGDSAFVECTGLRRLTIEGSVTKIGTKAFQSCTGLRTLVIGSGVTRIEASAFSGCTNLRYLVISDSVTSIGDSAFAGCTGIRQVYVGKNATSIGASAFNGCTAMEEIFIPSSVSFIGAKAFDNCNALATVRYEGSQVAFNKITVGKTNDRLKESAFEYVVSADNELSLIQGKIDALNPRP